MLMHRAGLAGLPGARRPRSKHQTPTAGDLVERSFARTEPNRLWVTDITEHSTHEGKVYCCVVLDVFSRRVVGWSIDSTPSATLVTSALGMAIDSRRPEPGALIHSDHGTQGGIKWSSQHLEQEVGRWRTVNDRSRSVCIGGRSHPRDARRWPGVRIGSGSGMRSPAA
jgi:putative transposase